MVQVSIEENYGENTTPIHVRKPKAGLLVLA